MLNAFSRTELILGQEKMDILKNSTVAVFGVGGVGSFTVEGLIRSGLGKIVLIDDDNICLTNINRQLHATRKTVGKAKVEAMKERILDINPKAEVITYQKFYSNETADELLNKDYDYVVDAIDTISGKIDLVVRCKEMNIPIISSMGAGNKLDPTRFTVSDIYKTTIDPLAKVMRKELRKRNIESLKVVYSTEEPIKVEQEAEASCKVNCICPPGTARNCSSRRNVPGSISFVPSVVGLIIAGEAIKDLTGVNKGF
ncbi:tRNA threonylcarbamoyladenosine dehydratase [Oxobacter pfennigii]|uniref:tRNA threonylcarbamoyladenosine dehydratase n=1 Tax=Oxobacter pfennigii TaxID=36849 RepID=A0A0P8X2D9_9CLOT|nr:tRNA threonylcarbamoyladenosine dehydratase [Oxobacter pfennigii]KPU44978.1 tRNA threonylcarbamoyladenosine dehydratase [Oxobacter pfennigii]